MKTCVKLTLVVCEIVKIEECFFFSVSRSVLLYIAS